MVMIHTANPRGSTPEERKAAAEELHSQLMGEARVRTKFPWLIPGGEQYKKLVEINIRDERRLKAERKEREAQELAEKQAQARRRRPDPGLER